MHTERVISISALLAEANSFEPMCLEAATEAVDFVRNHLYTPQNVVLDQIFAESGNCTGKPSLIEPYNAGLMIEGLSILSSITGDGSMQDL